MVDFEKSPRAPDSNVVTDKVSAADGQNHLFDVKLLPWAQIAFAQEYPEGGERVSIELYKIPTYHTTQVNTMIDMLNARRQMIHTLAEEMKEISHQLQSATKMQTSEEGLTAPSTLCDDSFLITYLVGHLANGFGAAPPQQQLWVSSKRHKTSIS